MCASLHIVQFFIAVMLAGPILFFCLRLMNIRLSQKYAISLAVIGAACWMFSASLFVVVTSAFQITIIIVLACLLIALIDLRFMIIPDMLVFSLALAGSSLHWTAGLQSPFLPLSGAVFGLLLLGLPYAYYSRILKRSGLGFGDVKLMGAIGLIVGPFQAPLVVAVGAAATLIAVLAASYMGTYDRPLRERRVPFAPGLLAAMLLSLVVGAT